MPAFFWTASLGFLKGVSLKGESQRRAAAVALDRLPPLAAPSQCVHCRCARLTAGFDCRAGAKGWVDWRFWGWLPALAGRGPPTDRALLVRWLAGGCPLASPAPAGCCPCAAAALVHLHWP